MDSQRRTRNTRQLSPLIDSLESRLLLSSTHSHAPLALLPAQPAINIPHTIGQDYDLVPTIDKLPKLSNTVITTNAVSGTVTVDITNTGFDASPDATYSIFLRPTAGNDILLTTTPVNIPALKGTVTKNGVTKEFNKEVSAKVTLPLNLAAGTYTLVIVVTDTSTPNSDENLNNTLVYNAFTLTATAGATNLSASLTAPKFPAIITVGTKASGSVSLTFTNHGNIPSTANTYNVALVLRSSGGTDIPLLTVNNAKFPSLKATNGTKSLNINLSISALQTSAIPSDTYTLVAILTPTGATTGANITVTGPNIIVPGSGSTTHNGPFLLHGDTIAFTATTEIGPASDFNFEFGTFTTNLHVTGNYQFVGDLITLNYDTGDTDALQFMFTNPNDPTYLNTSFGTAPTSVTFSNDATGAFGAFNFSNDPAIGGFVKFA